MDARTVLVRAGGCAGDGGAARTRPRDELPGHGRGPPSGMEDGTGPGGEGMVSPVPSVIWWSDGPRGDCAVGGERARDRALTPHWSSSVATPAAGRGGAGAWRGRAEGGGAPRRRAGGSQFAAIRAANSASRRSGSAQTRSTNRSVSVSAAV